MDHATTAEHSVISVSKEDAHYLQEINTSHNTLSQNKKNLQLIESELALLTAAEETAIKDMETFMELANKQLGQRKNDLRNLILDKFNTQRKTLIDKQNQIQESTKSLNENIAQAKTMTKMGDLCKLKPINESLRKVNEKMLSHFAQLDLGDNYLVFESDDGIDKLRDSLGTLGKIKSKGLLPTKITLTSTEAIAGLTTILTAVVFDHHEDKISVPAGSLSVQITDPTDTKLRVHVCVTGSKCSVTFQPQMSGLHQVSFMFLGQQLTSEQTHISVRSNNPVLKFGEKGNGKGAFKYPWAIAIDNNKCLYVTDTENHLIQKFTADGKFLNQFNVAVHNKDHTTCDIALDLNKGWIVCPEMLLNIPKLLLTGKNKMLVFNLEGELQNTYTIIGAENSFFVAINRHCDIITCDSTANSSIFKVGENSKFLFHMDGISLPGYIYVNDDDSVIVPDRQKHCINIFNPDGTLRHRFGSPGTGKGQVNEPYGIASDGEYILVTDHCNNRIQVFKYDGTIVSIIESSGDPLLKPKGLSVTEDGHVYVADWGHHCIKKYRYRDMSW